jgi:hypothetical protein
MKKNHKGWGARFLINFFYDVKKKEAIGVQRKEYADFAIEIDKMATFYMSYSPDVKTGAANPKKNQRRFFRKELRKDFQYDENINAYFSTEKASEYFNIIRHLEEFNPRDLKDRLVAFQLADGLLQESQIKEIAVLELLFLKMKEVNGLNHEEYEKIRKEFREKIKGDKAELREIIENFSPENIEAYFNRLGTIEGMIEYFKYQKNNGYPLIEYLKDIWVDSAIRILEIIIRKIVLTLKSGDHYSISEKYFPTHFSGDTPSIFEQKLEFYNDEIFTKKITYSKNKLSSLILEIFSDLDIELFGVCMNTKCSEGLIEIGKDVLDTGKGHEDKIFKRKAFIKYPKPEKKFCCNKCGAYHSAAVKRGYPI